MASEPEITTPYRQPTPGDYPMSNNQRSYETVASASGSGSSGEVAGYQTDPTSSDNSSIERMQAPANLRQEPVNDYGIGFSQNSTYQPSAFTLGVRGANGKGPQPGGYQGGGGPPLHYGAPPPVPQKERGAILRKPTADLYVEERPAEPEKRKSWFTRRFSKQN
jgi:hypothetical protein